MEVKIGDAVRVYGIGSPLPDGTPCTVLSNPDCLGAVKLQVDVPGEIPLMLFTQTYHLAPMDDPRGNKLHVDLVLSFFGNYNADFIYGAHRLLRRGYTLTSVEPNGPSGPARFGFDWWPTKKNVRIVDDMEGMEYGSQNWR